MASFSQLDASREIRIATLAAPLKVITHTFGQFGSFLGPTWDISRNFAPEKCQVAITGEAPIPQTSRMRAFSTRVNQAGTVRGHSRRLYTKLGVHTRDRLQAMLGI